MSTPFLNAWANFCRDPSRHKAPRCENCVYFVKPDIHTRCVRHAKVYHAEAMEFLWPRAEPHERCGDWVAREPNICLEAE